MNTPAPTSTPGSHWDPMYNQRDPNRQYTAEPTAGPSTRRDEPQYEEGFYPAANYTNAVPAVPGQYYGNLPMSYTTPATARRTSNNKPSTPPSAQANVPPAQASPSTRYYPDNASPATHIPPSPYQTSPQAASAPPQITTHHNMNQPQTAHPYGNNYYPYYDQNWYPPYPNAARPTPASTTPTIPQGPDRTPASTSSYDYNSSPYWAPHDPSRQQWAGRVGSSPQTAAPWYGHYPPPVVPQMGNQYWNPAYPQAYYPPVHPAAAKKPKKDKHKSPPLKDEYPGLGKRDGESADDEDIHGKKRKKGKKEKEESPVVKLPAKSHLNPPRQANSAWQLFFTDELNKAKAAAASGASPGGTPHASKLNVAQIAKDAGAAYATLSQEQREYYAGKVQESKEQYAKDLALWQSTLTPDDIRAENAFRAQQRKEGKSRKGNLKDPNAPKKPLSAYFLFLKGIREDEELRKKVWGDESETTRQSVLAAERWRGLTDEEKKPYLQQADKDKQEHEAARKIYEDEAAARARGEDLPPRPIIVPEVPKVSADPPKPRKKKDKPTLALDVKLETEPGLTNPPEIESFVEEFTNPDAIPEPLIPHVDSHDVPESFETMELGYDGFGDIDLSGLDGGLDVTGTTEWGDLGDLMNDHPIDNMENIDQHLNIPDSEPEQDDEHESGDISEAPALADAIQETAVEVPQVTRENEEIREIVAQAEGELVLPHPEQQPEPVVVREGGGIGVGLVDNV